MAPREVLASFDAFLCRFVPALAANDDLDVLWGLFNVFELLARYHSPELLASSRANSTIYSWPCGMVVTSTRSLASGECTRFRAIRNLLLN